jgi:hypothetical protein
MPKRDDEGREIEAGQTEPDEINRHDDPKAMFELELGRTHVATLVMAVPGAIQNCSKDF